TLICFDAKTGEERWRVKYGRVSRGAPVWADGKIYLAEVYAHFHILKPEDKRCRKLHDQFFPSKDGQGQVEVNGTPAVADGRIYFATRDEIYCIGKKDWKPAAPAGEGPKTFLNQDGTRSGPAHVQVVPADV